MGSIGKCHDSWLDDLSTLDVGSDAALLGSETIATTSEWSTAQANILTSIAIQPLDDAAAIVALVASAIEMPFRWDFFEMKTSKGTSTDSAYSTACVGIDICALNTALATAVGGIPVQPDVNSRDTGNEAKEDLGEKHFGQKRSG